jgi:hypothetical protein
MATPMFMCFYVQNVLHCYQVPVFKYQVPEPLHIKRPGPINYPALFRDASLVASLQMVADEISDDGVREGLRSGISAALQALQKRAGEHVTIRQDLADAT